jgi:hypothetical protein
LGQFVAHNITADRSILQSHTDTAGLHNARSPDGPEQTRSAACRAIWQTRCLCGYRNNADSARKNSAGVAIRSDVR